MLPTLAGRGRAGPSRALASALGRDDATTRIFGVEHEFGAFRDGEQVDFREVVHELPLDGVAIHPTNEHHYLTRRGSAVIADGLVAEVAIPPLALQPGFASRAACWAETCRAELDTALPSDFSLVGASTHLNVSVDPRHNDRLAVLYARTFSAPLMMLIDQPTSPGLLVRPRPGRLELGGEYLIGRPLTAAALFAVASVMAVEDHLRGRPGSLPPFLDVELEPGRRRYGWYVDRRAFGTDLYRDGRAAELARASGGTIAAGDLLVDAWALARRHARNYATADEIHLVDRVVTGDEKLPLELGSHGEPPNGAEPLDDHPMRVGTRTFVSGDLRLVPRSATWDWVVWDVTAPDGAVVVNVPRPRLDDFRREFERGALDRLMHQAVAQRHSLVPLTHVSQTSTGPAFFSDVQAGPALLPNDRYGIGTAPASSVRPGKRDLPAEGAASRSTTSTGGRTRGAVAAALLLLVAGLGLVAQLGRSALAQDDVQDPRSLIESVEPLDIEGEIWVLVHFRQPLTDGPPTDLFSYFFELVIDLGGGSSTTISWEIHDGVTASTAPGPFLVLDDGSVLARVGSGDPSDFRGTVSVSSASWVDEGTTDPVFSSGAFELDSSNLLAGDALGSRTVVYDLLNDEPVEPQPRTEWNGLTTVLGEAVTESDPEAAVVIDSTGDLQDYYGTFDSSRPDVATVGWSAVEFNTGYTQADRLSRLTEICHDGIGAGIAPICPQQLDSLASAGGWVLVDITFSGDESVVQAGLAWADPGSPVYEGAEFDPNTGRNRTLEVFTAPEGYHVGTLTFDGSFESAPSDDVLAVLRPDGVALIISSDALEGCTDPTAFVVSQGGVDLVSLPETPENLITVGPPSPGSQPSTTQSSSTTVTTTTVPTTSQADGSTPGTAIDTGSDQGSGQPSTSSGGSSPLGWLVLLGLGLIVLLVGVYLLATGGGLITTTPPPVMVVGVEKGTRPASPVGAK